MEVLPAAIFNTVEGACLATGNTVKPPENSTEKQQEPDTTPTPSKLAVSLWGLLTNYATGGRRK